MAVSWVVAGARFQEHAIIGMDIQEDVTIKRFK